MVAELFSLMPKMCCSHMHPMISTTSKVSSTITTYIWSFSSMYVNMVSQGLTISKAFTTMITVVFPILAFDMILLIMSRMLLSYQHQPTYSTWIFGVHIGHMAFQQILRSEHFSTLWTLLWTIWSVHFILVFSQVTPLNRFSTKIANN